MKSSPNSRSRFLRFTLSFLMVFVMPLGAAHAQKVQAADVVDKAREIGFAPHKALYDIKLAGTKSGSQIVNITGQMFYEWQPSCDSWISNHRFNLFYEYADSPAMHITSDFSTVESFDRNNFEFISQRKRDGELFEELRGHAAANAENPGNAVYTMPENLTFDLPKGSVFPMGHTLNVMDVIRQGGKFYNAVIFDGSDAEGPVEVNAFIGKPVVSGQIQQVSGTAGADLLKSPARNVRLAFFPLNDPSDASDYEMSIVFHDNGVISDMTIEYDDFSVSQTLIAVEPLTSTCKAGKSKKSREQ